MSKKQCKRMLELTQKLKSTSYSAEEAFNFLVSNITKKESVDVVYALGINGKKSDQVVKGVVSNLPHGLGKDISVAVFTKDAQEALNSGADFAGLEELIKDVKEEKIKADIYIATSDVIAELAKQGMGRVLKGKMPQPKFGTVVDVKNISNAVKEQKTGKLIFRSNAHLIHSKIGNTTFTKEALKDNFMALHNSIVASKPQVIKPHSYILKIFVSSTMSPSLRIDLGSLKG